MLLTVAAELAGKSVPAADDGEDDGDDEPAAAPADPLVN